MVLGFGLILNLVEIEVFRKILILFLLLLHFYSRFVIPIFVWESLYKIEGLFWVGVGGPLGHHREFCLVLLERVVYGEGEYVRKREFGFWKFVFVPLIIVEFVCVLHVDVGFDLCTCIAFEDLVGI